jgi:nucleoside-triphosphatase THEP1
LKKQIFILTGKVHTGKTTGLIEWLENKHNSAGIISPVTDGKRFLSLYPENKLINLEADEGADNGILICGRYKFYKEAFAKANDYIEALNFPELEWVIIDEAGLLEMRNEGLHESLETVLNKFNESETDFSLVIIVRDSLLEKIISKYNLEKYEVVKKEDLKNIT